MHVKGLVSNSAADSDELSDAFSAEPPSSLSSLPRFPANGYAYASDKVGGVRFHEAIVESKIERAILARGAMMPIGWGGNSYQP
jgi:hypothetical protein